MPEPSRIDALVANDAPGSAGAGAGKRGMGRGLAAILGGARDDEGTALRDLALELVRPNEHQPRKEFDGESLLALSESIRSRGVLQPIVVRPRPGGTYELIAGERRLRAAKMADLETIPALVRDTADAERLELAVLENVAREDLNPVDEARACATLVEDLGITKEELARRLGRNRVTISNLIRLLSLPDEVLDLLASGELSEGHGRALLVCRDHELRRRLAREASAGGWSVRETERRAREAQAGDGPPARATREPHPDLVAALSAGEDALSAALGREVKVRSRGDRVRVEFELDDPADALELARTLGTQRA